MRSSGRPMRSPPHRSVSAISRSAAHCRISTSASPTSNGAPGGENLRRGTRILRRGPRCGRPSQSTMPDGEVMSVAETSNDERAENIRMIRDSAGAIVPRGDLARIRALRFTEPGFDRAVWRQMCELGWLGLRVPEARGGAGLGMAEYCALAEECGAGLLLEPLIAGAMAAALITGAPLAQLLAGETIVIPAWQERPNSLAVRDTVLRDGR